MGPHHFCGCGNPPNTFWEKEVLLMRTELQLPPMREGYAYRLLVGGRSHVGSGEGSDVWINGIRKEGRRSTDPSIRWVGRRSGGQPWGFVIDDDFRQQFTNDTVTLAATGFLPIHKSGVKRNYIAFWFEEMKLPELGEREMLNVLRVTPLKTATWQSTLADEDTYQFNGTFEENKAVAGSWEQIVKVDAITDFDPAARNRRNQRAPFQKLNFRPGGRTDDPKVMYSAEMLFDIENKQALKMTLESLDDNEYLFLEAGGFKESHPDDWQTPYYVFKRVEE
jgi:hypothetical protein